MSDPHDKLFYKILETHIELISVEEVYKQKNKQAIEVASKLIKKYGWIEPGIINKNKLPYIE